MPQNRTLLLLFCASLAAAQGADSILLLNPATIMQINTDPQGNLLVAQRVGLNVSASRYSPQGQLIQSFTAPNQTLSAGGSPVVLTSDSQGVIYLGGGSTLLRPADNPPAVWTPQLPSAEFEIDGIGFDRQNNPILAITMIDPPYLDGQLLKLDRTTGQILANFDIGAGVTPTAMLVDSGGAVYVTGMRYLTGFAAKFDLKLQGLLYFTSLDAAMPHGIAVDPSGEAYIAETPFAVPVTIGPPNGGAVIHFGANTVYKLDPSGAIIASNTGGGSAIALDHSGNVIVAGGTYPPTGAFQTACGPRTDLGGLSVTVLNAVNLQPQASAFLAQQSFQSASALLPDGSLYVATQANRVLHVSPAAASSPIACIANGASYLVESSIVPGQLLTIFGRGLGIDPINVYDSSQQLPFSSNGTSVRIGGYPAPLLAVSSSQINAIVPYEVNEPAAIEISRNGSIIYTWQMNLAVRNPTPLLRFDSSGALDFFQAPDYQDILTTHPVPLANVLNQDGTPNSAANPAPQGSTVTIFATGFGQLGGVWPDVDGAPGGNPPQWPADILPDFPLPALADIPVWTPGGSLTLPLPTPITTIGGLTNAVLQVKATIPTFSSGVPAQLPFVIGPLPAAGTQGWTNFLYVARSGQ